MLYRFTLSASLALAACVPLALAHEGATGVVKERMDLMDTQKEAMKILGSMAKGKIPFDAAKAALAARDIETTSAKIPELFPEGSSGGHSEAKPEVWTKWDEFTGDAEALAAAAKDLVMVLENGAQDWTAKFQGVTDACKTCHKTFRAEKKD
jgi:cytochrome c556